jgi:c-di-GMP-binding flagellar brake protein YcgR
MGEAARDILSVAVARNSAMVISLPSAGMLRHHRSRFLNEVEGGVWIESVPTERALIDELIVNAQPCGVSFKTGDQKISFASQLLKVDPAYQVNADTVVAALLVNRPAEVKAVQRRSNYRVKPPEDSELSVKLWRIPEHVRLQDKPLRAAELAVELRDLSLGGMGVTILPREGEPPKVLPDERVRILLRFGADEEFLIEGRMRAPHSGAKADTIATGIQFQKLQEGLEGRQALASLTKLIGAMSMEEARRHRMGI